MLNSKDRATLKSVASKIDAKLQLGKGGINDNSITTINEVLDKDEIIKIKVLKNLDEDMNTLVDEITSKTFSEVVYTIGNFIILYKKSNRKNIKHLLK